MAGDKQQEAAYRAADLRLFESGHFSDIVVTCGPRSWNLHKNILYTRSVWFEKAIAGSYVAGQQRAQGASFDEAIRIQEQNPAAVEVCLRYIYGGVAAIDMEKETSFRPTFKFCGELYRSADFFLLKPLLPVVQHYLGAYCDEKIRWMFTRGNTEQYHKNYPNNQKVLDWIEDLKDAIFDVQQWKTPVIREMLMEFVFAGEMFLDQLWQYPPTTTYKWLCENAWSFQVDKHHHCVKFPPGYVVPNLIPKVWTPARCQTSIPVNLVNNCVRCRNRLPMNFSKDKEDYGKIHDPFNLGLGWRITRAWCKECAAEVKYPWREDGYL